MNADLEGKFYSWDFNLNTNLSSLDIDRLHESSRAKLAISKSFNLNNNDNIESQIPDRYLIEKMVFENFLDVNYQVHIEKN